VTGCTQGRSGNTGGMVVALLAIASLGFIPLLVVGAVRVTRTCEFRAARGPGVPDFVPADWLREGGLRPG